MNYFDKLISKLKNHREPVSDREWKRLGKMLNGEPKSGRPGGGIRKIRLPLTIAAGLFLLIGVGLSVLIFSEEDGKKALAGSASEDRKVLTAFGPVDRLNHRADISGEGEKDETVSTGGITGSVPYRAILPNGDNWLIHLQLVRDSENCEATIKTINDKAVQLHLGRSDENCSELKSDSKMAEMKLLKENGQERIVLVLMDGATGENDQTISMELERIY